MSVLHNTFHPMTPAEIAKPTQNRPFLNTAGMMSVGFVSPPSRPTMTSGSSINGKISFSLYAHWRKISRLKQSRIMYVNATTTPQYISGRAQCDHGTCPMK